MPVMLTMEDGYNDTERSEKEKQGMTPPHDGTKWWAAFITEWKCTRCVSGPCRPAPSR
jgi:hypothetical protein